MKKYIYFVSYKIPGKNGMIEITLDSKIEYFETISKIKKYLDEMNKTSEAIIVNYQLLRIEKED